MFLFAKEPKGLLSPEKVAGKQTYGLRSAWG